MFNSQISVELPKNGRSKPKSTHQSLKRAIAIMRLFSEAEPTLSVAEVSQRLSLHKSTASRIMSVLHEEGLLEIHPETGRYSPGVGLLTLAGVALGQIDVRAASFTALESLVEQSQETVTVSILQGNETIAVAHMPSPQSIRYAVWVGRRTNLMQTASGRLFLSYLNDRKPINGQHQIKASSNANLFAIQKQGYALEIDEFEEGISAIAAPIFDYRGEIKAAISIAGPTYRLSPAQLEAFKRPLQEQAFLVSERLGFTGAYPLAAA